MRFKQFKHAFIELIDPQNRERYQCPKSEEMTSVWLIALILNSLIFQKIITNKQCIGYFDAYLTFICFSSSCCHSRWYKCVTNSKLQSQTDWYDFRLVWFSWWSVLTDVCYWRSTEFQSLCCPHQCPFWLMVSYSIITIHKLIASCLLLWNVIWHSFHTCVRF